MLKNCFFFQMLRNHGLVDEGAPDGEDQSAKQTRIREMHDAIERKVHGPDHKRQALLNAAEVSGREEPSVSLGSQSAPVGRDPSGATAGGPADQEGNNSPDGMQNPQDQEEEGPEASSPEVFSMATPRTKEEVRKDAASPDLLAGRPEVGAVWDSEAFSD